MMKLKYIPHIVLCLSLSFAAAGLIGCGDDPLLDEGGSSSAGRPLADGELSNVTFINSVSSIEEITTRSIPDDKKTVLHDYTNHELKGKDGGNAGWMSGEVRTGYGEEEKRAVTRSFDQSTQLFGKNSKFRMLVFVGAYGGSVDMSKPIANMVCQVNAAGNGASFLSPSTSLGLLRGRYTFVCFPADEKYNTWEVGKTSGNQISVGKDEDFVCMQYANRDINTSTTQIPLNVFTRFGYQLTVKFSVNKELGYLLFPQKELELEISDAGSGETGRVINTKASFDLKTNALLNYTGNTASFKDTIQIDKAAMGQTFTPVSNFMIANSGASQKLTIKYPQLTVLKPKATEGNASGAEDSVFTIKGGTYTTTEAVQFTAGNSYSITLAVGKQIKGIAVIFQNSSGAKKTVIFAKSQLNYNKSTGKWGWGKEQCDYGYVENNINPGSADMKLVNGTISYYFMYGKPEGCIGTSTSGYYSGSSNLFDVNLDPCQKMGDKWISPTSEIINMLCCLNDYHPVDENGQRMSSYGSWSSYTPTDGRTNKSAIPGRWLNTSSPSGTQYNSSRLFLPAAGDRYNSGTSVYDVGTDGAYWSSQPNGDLGYALDFTSSYCRLYNYYRYLGFPVRCCLPE